MILASDWAGSVSAVTAIIGIPLAAAGVYFAWKSWRVNSDGQGGDGGSARVSGGPGSGLGGDAGDGGSQGGSRGGKGGDAVVEGANIPWAIAKAGKGGKGGKA
jgi:hypothetical protein